MDNIEKCNLSAVLVLNEDAALKSKIKSYQHTLWGKSVLNWTAAALGEYPYVTVSQFEGTDLLAAVKDAADADSEFTAVLYADTPLLTSETLQLALEQLISNNLSAMQLPAGWLFRTAELAGITSLNTPDSFLFQGEEQEFLRVTDYRTLAEASNVLRRRILYYHMDNGVFFADPATAYVDADAVIEPGVAIHANNHVQGKCVLHKDCILNPNNVLKNCEILDGAVITSSTLSDCRIGKGTTVGPYAYIRNNAVIGDNVRVGDYVEIKKSDIGNGTKIAHLTYVGDATIGEQCNLGCGVVFANYDGKNKHNTTVGNRVFIGSNSNLIAPVTLEDGSFIAAGTTVTKTVPAKKMCIGRVRQEIKDYKSKYLAEEQK